MTVRKPVADELQGYLSKEGELRKRFLKGSLDPQSVLGFLQSTIEEKQNTIYAPLAQRELDALKVYRRQKDIMVPSRAQIVQVEWKHWQFAMPGGLTRQPALSSCQKAGIPIWRSNSAEADCTGEILPTKRGII